MFLNFDGNGFAGCFYRMKVSPGNFMSGDSNISFRIIMEFKTHCKVLGKSDIERIVDFGLNNIYEEHFRKMKTERKLPPIAPDSYREGLSIELRGQLGLRIYEFF
jgi:hypothetical protein